MRTFSRVPLAGLVLERLTTALGRTAMLSGVSLANPFPANTQGKTCYSLYMTLTNSSALHARWPSRRPRCRTARWERPTVLHSAQPAARVLSTWSLTSGTLPAGLNLSASGVISGTPTASVNATALTFKVTDSSSPVQTPIRHHQHHGQLITNRDDVRRDLANGHGHR